MPTERPAVAGHRHTASRYFQCPRLARGMVAIPATPAAPSPRPFLGGGEAAAAAGEREKVRTGGPVCSEEREAPPDKPGHPTGRRMEHKSATIESASFLENWATCLLPQVAKKEADFVFGGGCHVIVPVGARCSHEQRAP